MLHVFSGPVSNTSIITANKMQSQEEVRITPQAAGARKAEGVATVAEGPVPDPGSPVLLCEMPLQ
jgi:hypothetical protein